MEIERRRGEEVEGREAQKRGIRKLREATLKRLW
jgi:hypothetical protein